MKSIGLGGLKHEKQFINIELHNYKVIKTACWIPSTNVGLVSGREHGRQISHSQVL